MPGMNLDTLAGLVKAHFACDGDDAESMQMRRAYRVKAASLYSSENDSVGSRKHGMELFMVEVEAGVQEVKATNDCSAKLGVDVIAIFRKAAQHSFGERHSSF